MTVSIADRLKRLSLRRQQLLFFAVVTVFVIVLIGTSVGVTARYAEVFGTNLNRYFHIQELRSALSLTHERVEIFFRHGDETALERIDEAAELVETSYRRLNGMGFTDVPSRHELQATFYGLIAYRAAVQEAIGLMQGGDDRAFVSLARADRIRGYVDLYLERLFQIQLNYGRRGYEAALRQQNAIRVLGISGILLVGVALTVFALLFSRSVTRPLDRLAREAHALAAGDFDRPAMEVPVSGDLQDVALAFNRMTTGIRELVANLKDQHQLQQQLHQQELSNLSMERLLREAQLVALQSQVNPHFLFNTLNSVARTARLENAERSEKLIRGLSSVLRYILRNPRRSVALHEEMRIVEEYLALQAVRFGERLRYRVAVAPEARTAQIPPLILQPLVENAVLYGIEPIEKGGIITVTATTDAGDHTLRISIADDGAGMDATTVELLSADETETTGDTTTGIGVLNVRARLKLFFGPEQRFDMTSAPGNGTRIEISIPYNEEAETYGLQRADS
ncbi:MAG: histidine kinase [Spirochaeta sp.]|jgi:two-component system sensor histidine kinase YesM|nr:histidine kinase [Spirochaeta sp.]